MFNLSNHAYNALLLAKNEALQSEHERTGTSDLLLGLIRGGYGIASSVLRNRNITIQRAREQSSNLVKKGVIDKTPLFSSKVHSAIHTATSIANNQGIKCGTEHLLLGLLEETDCIGCQIIMNLGVSINDVRSDITALMQNNEARHDHLKLREIKRLLRVSDKDVLNNIREIVKDV